MKFTVISTCLLASFTFSDEALGYASPHLHRRALGPRASNTSRSMEVVNPSNVLAPTPPALLSSQNNTNNNASSAPKPKAQLTLSAIPANTTMIFVSSTSTGPIPTGTAAAIGGIQPPNIERTSDPDRPYSVNGDKFTDIEDAVDRACSIQHNACADAINNGALSDAEISDCDNQLKVCVAAT
ncbi:hypothetical protein sscle_04g036550 [Sclerotinia sclerotiorum 1980 UF-70]|uniref:Uncharacterized protein n=2 Tax=Sclerotinia sclerotiorum (strain ATCC 18683 / 1980 / Ss-1) TaxID=665079 RepID=A0A1D9Q1R5_SCLS1|nr:hypothetical protein sscle_04g036550 [Sclerotinia sclerotiorum 1980 UF-70]